MASRRLIVLDATKRSKVLARGACSRARSRATRDAALNEGLNDLLQLSHAAPRDAEWLAKELNRYFEGWGLVSSCKKRLASSFASDTAVCPSARRLARKTLRR